MYINGLGFPQDYAEAAKWYRMGADQGNSTAQMNLGIMYFDGTGVIQDYLMSHMHLNLAASKGEEKAAQNREVVTAKMTSDQIAKAQQMAREWMEKHE